ncbi:MAG: hypothetical protein FJ288_16905 [Planctomycetes bacterium]|nr:hypothetical protein [Planctomycetota bacterium]
MRKPWRGLLELPQEAVAQDVGPRQRRKGKARCRTQGDRLAHGLIAGHTGHKVGDACGGLLDVRPVPGSRRGELAAHGCAHRQVQEQQDARRRDGCVLPQARATPPRAGRGRRRPARRGRGLRRRGGSRRRGCRRCRRCGGSRRRRRCRRRCGPGRLGRQFPAHGRQDAGAEVRRRPRTAARRQQALHLAQLRRKVRRFHGQAPSWRNASRRRSRAYR